MNRDMDDIGDPAEDSDMDDLKDSVGDAVLNIQDLSLYVVKMGFYLFGASLAMIVSFSQHHSIPWGIGHGILSWGYVIYYAIVK